MDPLSGVDLQRLAVTPQALRRGREEPRTDASLVSNLGKTEALGMLIRCRSSYRDCCSKTSIPSPQPF